MTTRRRFTRYAHGCLTECVARIFNQHPETVPLFIAHRNWPRKLKAYFKARGLGLKFCHYGLDALGPDDIYIAVGRTAPRTYHCALYKGSTLLYDPRGRQRPFRGKPLQMWIPYANRRRKSGIKPRVRVPGEQR